MSTVAVTTVATAVTRWASPVAFDRADAVMAVAICMVVDTPTESLR